jgi:hypothetical protein
MPLQLAAQIDQRVKPSLLDSADALPRLCEDSMNGIRARAGSFVPDQKRALAAHVREESIRDAHVRDGIPGVAVPALVSTSNFQPTRTVEVRLDAPRQVLLVLQIEKEDGLVPT